jgi:hypothetical protein
MVDLRDGTSIEEMAHQVLEPVKGSYVRVWADNAFTSVAMLNWCLERKIYFCGTTRTTYGFPSEIMNPALPTGGWEWRMAPAAGSADNSNALLAAFWRDVGDVKLMSNWHLPTEDVCHRRVKGQSEREERDCPSMATGYNFNMGVLHSALYYYYTVIISPLSRATGGVDDFDFLRGVFTTHRIGRKWWRTLFYFSLDAAMGNAHIKYTFEMQQQNAVAKKMLRKDFILAVARKFVFPANASQAGTAAPAGAAAGDLAVKSKKQGRCAGLRDLENKFKHYVPHTMYDAHPGEAGPANRKACVWCAAQISELKKEGMGQIPAAEPHRPHPARFTGFLATQKEISKQIWQKGKSCNSICNDPGCKSTNGAAAHLCLQCMKPFHVHMNARFSSKGQPRKK